MIDQRTTILGSMIRFAQATRPPQSKNSRAVRVALLYAGVLVVFVVAQLFSFEKFLPLVRDFALPGGRPLAYFLAAFIVIAEVLALPFLLRMQLSVAMRLLSMVMGWLVALLWVAIALWLTLTGSTVTNIGFFGGVVAFAPGWLSVAVGLVLGGMATCVSRGMWPIVRRK